MVGAEQSSERLELGEPAVEVGPHCHEDDRPAGCRRVRQGGHESLALGRIGGRGEDLLELIHDDEDPIILGQDGGSGREGIGDARQALAQRLVESGEHDAVQLAHRFCARAKKHPQPPFAARQSARLERRQESGP